MAGAAETLTLDGLADWASAAGGKLRRLDLTRPLDVCRQLIVSDVKRNFNEGHGPDGAPWDALAHPRPGSQGADKPLRDTGALLASIVSQGGEGHVEERTPTSLTVGTALESAPLHQHGGVVKPVKAKALAIPLTEEARKYSSPRDFPRDLALVSRGHDRPALLVESKAGRGQKERGAQSVFHYLLVDQVTIPARPFLGFSEQLIADIRQVFADFLAGQL